MPEGYFFLRSDLQVSCILSSHIACLEVAITPQLGEGEQRNLPNNPGRKGNVLVNT